MIPKFRGKSIADENKGKWMCGNLIADKTSAYITDGDIDVCEDFISIERWCSIDVNTVGQSTGLFDKNGTEIFEGDALKNNDYPNQTFICKHSRLQASFQAESLNGLLTLSLWKDEERDWQVLGNIYENPELMEGDA
jgi:uncharacterized phage protein (TIGR01671 family)